MIIPWRPAFQWRNQGISSFDYQGGPAGSASLRYGLEGRLTVEGHARQAVGFDLHLVLMIRHHIGDQNFSILSGFARRPVLAEYLDIGMTDIHDALNPSPICRENNR